MSRLVTLVDHPLKPNTSFARSTTFHPSMYVNLGPALAIARTATRPRALREVLGPQALVELALERREARRAPHGQPRFRVAFVVKCGSSDTDRESVAARTRAKRVRIHRVVPRDASCWTMSRATQTECTR